MYTLAVSGIPGALSISGRAGFPLLPCFIDSPDQCYLSPRMLTGSGKGWLVPHTTLEPHTTVKPSTELVPQTTAVPQPTAFPLLITLVPHTTLVPQTTTLLQTELGSKLTAVVPVLEVNDATGDNAVPVIASLLFRAAHTSRYPAPTVKRSYVLV